MQGCVYESEGVVSEIQPTTQIIDREPGLGVAMGLLARRCGSALMAALLAFGMAQPAVADAQQGDPGSAGSLDVAGSSRAPDWDSVPAGPREDDFGTAFRRSLLNPAMLPDGVNDWDCTPSPEHPNPVVLVHGTWSNAYTMWSALAPELVEEGYCVYALNYGDENQSLVGLVPGLYASRGLVESSTEVAAFVERVLDETGASKVDMVGHSQGGTQLQLYIQRHGGDQTVERMVGVNPNTHGTSLLGIGTLGWTLDDAGSLGIGSVLGSANVSDPGLMATVGLVIGPAGVQQAIGSPVIEEMIDAGDTRPGLDYTIITSRYDEVVTPYTGQVLVAGPGATVRNILLQDGCPEDRSDHLSATYSLRGKELIKQGLDPARRGQPVPCEVVVPGGGQGWPGAPVGSVSPSLAAVGGSAASVTDGEGS